jgi:hypothetical protein
MQLYSAFDGYWDVFRSHVTLPPNLTVEQVQACPFCSPEGLAPSPDYLTALETDVIAPARVIQELLDAHPHVTRLYSTLSAAEMTVDPLFTYNPDLEPISNLHTAERIIECGPGYFQWEAPWRIELPQGGVVRGGPSDIGTWPAAFNSLPANRRILRQAESGAGKVLEDNSEGIDADIATYSDSRPTPPKHAPIGGSGSGAGTAGSTSQGNPLTPPGSPLHGETSGGGGCACRITTPGGSLGGLLAGALALSLLFERRRRAARR